VPAGPYRSVDELRNDPQVVANGFIVDLEHPLVGHLRMVGPPIKFSETPSAVQGPSPMLGQHNDEIMAQLGYSPDEIAAYREKGIIK
jgi:crotonobetainyl-CoA:carnitine CoA-transferase CaiB-like acyl-CoA transferase